MDENLTKKPAYFGALAALTGTNPQPPSNSTNGTFTFGNNVTSTGQPGKVTFVSGASSIVPSCLWTIFLMVALHI
jgi:endo-1,4-beta-xylanase